MNVFSRWLPWGGDARNAAATGRRGERLARRWLRRRGYRVLSRNHRVGRDEADVIALDPDGRTIVVVEVKTRTGSLVAPEQDVTPGQQRRLVRLAQRICRNPALAGRSIRFDVIAVEEESGRPTIRHHRNAFTTQSLTRAGPGSSRRR